MKVKIDKKNCTGCSTCIVLCPENFEFDSEGKSAVKKQPSLSEFDQVTEAIEACPEDAIIKTGG